MNLTDLANHICAQCGMNDTDDVAVAKMFLQRRLEMIWNTQLWRASLIEATMTLNPDGTCTLGNTIWIPIRSTLLLPTAFDSVLAVRADNHAMNVASLESYYRTDTDWLNMQGDPFEFQVLKPVVAEFSTPQSISLMSATADTGAIVNISFSPDGVTITNVNANPNTDPMGANVGTALQIFSLSKPATQSTAELLYADEAYLTYGDYTVGVNDTGLTVGSVVRNPADGFFYQLVNAPDGYMVTGAGDGPVNGFYVPYGIKTTYTLASWLKVIPSGQRSSFGIFENLNANDYFTINSLGLVIYSQDQTINSTGPDAPYISNTPGFALPLPTVTFTLGYYPAPPDPNYWTQVSIPKLVLPVSSGNLPVHQRIRLTTAPQTAVNLRVLGKTVCPVLGDYDTMPINNVEPCLMAFARGDLLLRQRQNGKAQIAAQEGASLLAQLARSEAFQTANNFRIVPDNGFGGDNVISQPNSLHPL